MGIQSIYVRNQEKRQKGVLPKTGDGVLCERDSSRQTTETYTPGSVWIPQNSTRDRERKVVRKEVRLEGLTRTCLLVIHSTYLLKEKFR